MKLKDEIKQKQLSLQALVMHLLDLSEVGMNTLLFETGAEYIERRSPAPIASEFLAEPIYWGWWKSQWALVDEYFLSKSADMECLTPQEMRNLYEQLHEDIDRMPDKIVYEKVHDTYHTMSRKVAGKLMNNIE